MPVTLLTSTDRSDSKRDGLVDAGAGLLVYRYLGCRSEPEADSGEIEVTLWALYSDAARRYEIDRIEVQRPAGGPALSSTELRAVPVASLLAGISHRAAWGTAEPAESNNWSFRRPFNMPNNELPKKLDDSAYRKIGLVHRSHEILGNKATTELARHFDVGRTTAYSWLKEIEDRGLMRPVVPPEEASKIGPNNVLQGDSMPPKELSAELAYRRSSSADELATLLARDDALFSPADIEAEVARRYLDGESTTVLQGDSMTTAELDAELERRYEKRSKASK